MAFIKIDVPKNAFKKLADKLKQFESPINRETADEIGKEVIKTMKEKISSGQSPIRGGRMPSYRGSYKDRIEKGYYDGKELRPVNLTLTGKFLNELESIPNKTRYGYETLIGFFKKYGSDLERGHREGANKQKKRPIIPKDGERFNASIMLVINRIFRNRIRELIKK